jgi:hypothetical protein
MAWDSSPWVVAVTDRPEDPRGRREGRELAACLLGGLVQQGSGLPDGLVQQGSGLPGVEVAAVPGGGGVGRVVHGVSLERLYAIK